MVPALPAPLPLAWEGGCRIGFLECGGHTAAFQKRAAVRLPHSARVKRYGCRRRPMHG